MRNSRSSSSNIMSDSSLRNSTFCFTSTISFRNLTFQAFSAELSENVSFLLACLYILNVFNTNTTYLRFFPFTGARFPFTFWYKYWTACFGDFIIDWIKFVNLQISIVLACVPLNSSMRYLWEL